MNLVALTVAFASIYAAFFVASSRWWSFHWRLRVYRVLNARNLEMSGRTIAKTLGRGATYVTVYIVLDSLIDIGLVESRVFEISPWGHPRKAYWASGTAPQKRSTE